MSHITRVKTDITHLPSAVAALQEMGFQVLGPGTVHGGGRTQAVEAVIAVPGKYQLGLARAGDGQGAYEVVGDWYYAQRQVGGQAAFMNRLNQLYDVHRATHEAMVNGYLVERETDASGVIRLTLSLP